MVQHRGDAAAPAGIGDVAALPIAEVVGVIVWITSGYYAGTPEHLPFGNAFHLFPSDCFGSARSYSS
jgi:hypothetical protein